MSTAHRPRKGSLAFSPRTRARQLFPQSRKKLNLNLETFYGVKVGMITYKDVDGYTPGTVLELPETNFINYKVYFTPFDSSQKRGFKEITELDLKEFYDNTKVISKLERGTFELSVKYSYDFSKTGSELNKKTIREIRISSFEELNQDLIDSLKEVNVEKLLSHETYDIRGVTKGKGNTGIVKKWGCKLKKGKHSRANKTRLIGSISTRGLQRIRWTAPMAGQKGCQNRTIYSLKNANARVDKKLIEQEFAHYGFVKNKYLVLRGSVVGPAKRIISINKSTRR